MRKLILILTVITVVSVAFTSCKNDKKEEVKTEEKTDMASNEVYQCPMNCEDGKSYTEAGNCPVCKMELKAKTVDMDADTPKKHSMNCDCKKEGSECKCAEGECKCMAGNDSSNQVDDKDKQL
ncbi:hypothetical protein EGM88_03580 [Aureibaculum marinum]|uniref:Heavy metal binding domain-containing protein n=1 Tax=Aureibaculum marinum TaxID=2487930 RepID=A0A3N4P3X7_9FLAO|nr:heavy metal-binding domain-containing protein [Aureibaculum marinum]RPD99636.1 hypothetical protein EGM88_03580 [Aureibaculum marinum]